MTELDRQMSRFFDIAHEGAQARAIASSIREHESGWTRLEDFQPRSVVIVARDAINAAAARLAVRLCTRMWTPMVVVSQLPHYVGVADVIIAISDRGDDPQLAQSLIDAKRRLGSSIVFVGPARGPIVEDLQDITMNLYPLPNVAGPSPVRALCAITAVLSAMHRSQEGALDRLVDDYETLAFELDEQARQLSPENDLFLNPARQLRAAVEGGRALHVGGGPVAEPVAEFVSVLWSARGLSSGWIPAAEVGQAMAASHGTEDIFHDPFLDEAPRLLPLKAVLWEADGEYGSVSPGGYEDYRFVDVPGAHTVSCPPTKVGAVGQALLLSTVAYAATIFES